MERLDDMLERPDLIAKVLFWIGGVIVGLAIVFYVVQRDRINVMYEIQVPFGLLLLILTSMIIMIFIFVLTNLYTLLKYQERLGFFTPVTRAMILLSLVLLIISTEIIGEMIYYIVRILTLEGELP